MHDGMPEPIRGVQFLRNARGSTDGGFCATTDAPPEELVPGFARLVAIASLSLVACTTPAEVREACADSADCAEDLACVGNPSASDPLVCMQTCDPTTTWLCAGGEVCLDLVGTPERAVCYLGGALGAGASCLDRELDCVAGTVCVTFEEEGARAECMKACRLDGSDCGDGESCAELIPGRNAGFCQPAT